MLEGKLVPRGEGKLVARSDCGTFILTKSATVLLFLQYTI